MAKKEENEKKQLLLRLSTSLWNDLNLMAQNDFRSINGEIEYLLTQAVIKYKKNNKDEI